MRAVEDCALQEYVKRIFPSEAHAAVRFGRRPPGLDTDLSEMGIGDGRGPGGVGHVPIPAVRGIPQHRPTRLNVERHGRELMLDRLEGAERTPELLANLDIVDGHVACPP